MINLILQINGEYKDNSYYNNKPWLFLKKKKKKDTITF